MKIRRARSLAAKAYETSNTGLASAALEILRHYPRRDRVASGLAAFVKGVGVPPFAFTLRNGSGIALRDGSYLTARTS